MMSMSSRLFVYIFSMMSKTARPSMAGPFQCALGRVAGRTTYDFKKIKQTQAYSLVLSVLPHPHTQCSLTAHKRCSLTAHKRCSLTAHKVCPTPLFQPFPKAAASTPVTDHHHHARCSSGCIQRGVMPHKHIAGKHCHPKCSCIGKYSCRDILA